MNTKTQNPASSIRQRKSDISAFGHSYENKIECHDPNNTVIFTNNPKSTRVHNYAGINGATQIVYEEPIQ